MQIFYLFYLLLLAFIPPCQKTPKKSCFGTECLKTNCNVLKINSIYTAQFYAQKIYVP